MSKEGEVDVNTLISGCVSDGLPPSLATEAVLVQSEEMPAGTDTIKGYDFNHGVDYHKLLQSYATSGFQAQNFGRAVKEINNMIDCKLKSIPEESKKEVNIHPTGRPQTNCTIFLSYTSNLISAGVREIIKYLVQHNMVDCIVTTAGGIEEDFIKCMAPTYVGDFSLSGRELRDKGINRIGNLLVPNENYCKFEDWLMPILDKMLQEQKEEKTLWTPSRMINRLGKEIDNPDSVYYWAYKVAFGSTRLNSASSLGCTQVEEYVMKHDITGSDEVCFVNRSQEIVHRRTFEVDHETDREMFRLGKWVIFDLNNIPVYCPAITDGSLGDMIYFHSYNKPGLVLDLVQDIRGINSIAVQAVNSGMIILGGGVIKHHTCNANLMRNGADFAVYLNTASEFDGSDSGASPDEAISWGKIRKTANPVKICAEATLVFPLLVAETFARREKEFNKASSIENG